MNPYPVITPEIEIQPFFWSVWKICQKVPDAYELLQTENKTLCWSVLIRTADQDPMRYNPVVSMCVDSQNFQCKQLLNLQTNELHYDICMTSDIRKGQRIETRPARPTSDLFQIFQTHGSIRQTEINEQNQPH